MEKTTAILALAIIAIASYTVGSDAMSESEFQAATKNISICDLTGEDEICKQMSKNLYSCYPYAENRTKAKRCGTSDNNGKWISFNDYAKILGVDPFTLYIERITEIDTTDSAPITTGSSQGIEKCTPSGCIHI